MMDRIILDDAVVTYNDDRPTRDAVFEAVIAFYMKHNTFCSESICQDDNSIIDSHMFLANMADNILKFEVKYS